jgi:DNA-binding protein H-NS
MAQTYKQIQKQIEQLQRQADALRNSEVKGVVDRIKVAIVHYGLTAAHLGLGSAPIARAQAAASKPAAKPKAKAKAKSNSKAQFSDGSGNVWAGRGPRPHWLRDALKAGHSIEEFRAGSASAAITSDAPGATAQAAAPARKNSAKKSKRAPSKVNYTDGAGHSWTGRGPKPGWLKTAIEGGKSLADFAR